MDVIQVDKSNSKFSWGFCLEVDRRLEFFIEDFRKSSVQLWACIE